MYLILADIIVVIHFVFIIFALFGGLLVFKWPKMIWPHLCALLWGFYIEVTGGLCPLTPLETGLRVQAGADPYAGGFISHYLVPLIYPAEYNINMQILGLMILFVTNAVIYSLLFWRTRMK